MGKTRRKTTQRGPLGQLLSTYEEEEEDTEDHIIADGARIRVGLQFMDGLQKAVAKDKVNIDSGPTIVDGFGQSDRYSLSKPGARYLATNPTSTDHAVLTTREQLRAEAYADADAHASNAWRTQDDHPLLSSPRGTKPGKQEGSGCSIDGRSGHLQMVNGELVCIADKQDAQSVADAYAAYDEQQRNAWRS